MSFAFPIPHRRALTWAAMLVALVVSWAQAIAQTAPGDPALQISQVFPKSSRWRPTESIGYKVEILHPFESGRSTPTPWTTAPTGGWGQALRLIVTDASGAAVPWPFRLSAPNKTQPLEISHLMSAGAAFNLDPRNSSIPVLPGTYTVQAELAVSSGDGWRGRVVSKALPLTVLAGIEPVLEIQSVVDGPLVQGVPWGIRARLSMPDDPDAKQVQLPGGAGGWPTNTQLIVRNAAGAVVSWNWTAPRLASSDNRFLSPGESFPFAHYRLSATNTAPLPAGHYTLTARYLANVKHPIFDYWLGTAESAPISVTVQAPAVPEDVTSMARRWRWEAEDALEEAKGLRLAASETGVPNDRRLELTRQAAVPLLRAETAAQRWLLLQPSSPEPALLLSQILVNQDDKYLAAAWVQTASEIDLATPTTEPDAPPRNTNAPNPFLLSWRQSIDALPEVPNALLSPELQFTLNLARGTLPEPTNLAEQDKYFAADPRGQWAASAQASRRVPLRQLLRRARHRRSRRPILRRQRQRLGHQTRRCPRRMDRTDLRSTHPSRHGARPADLQSGGHRARRSDRHQRPRPNGFPGHRHQSVCPLHHRLVHREISDHRPADRPGSAQP